MKKPTTVFIDKEYLSMVPRPTEEQYEELKKSIEENGLLNPLVVNKDGKVLDGHTRFDICSKLNIIPEYEVKSFKTINEERDYVIISNLKRRHLNTFQICELSQSLRKILNRERMKEGVIEREKAKRGEIPKQTPQERLKRSTRYTLGKITGLSPSTVDKANYIIDHGTKIEIEKVRSNKISLEQMYRLIKNNRHKKSGIIKRNNHVLPNCPECGTMVRLSAKCHVHEKYCCRNCRWGR